MTRTLVLGGARSGKSRHAESLLAGRDAVTYVATGLPTDASDPEWRQRVEHHRARRPPGWRTVETLDVAAAVRTADTAVLVDCLATWLARLVDEVDGWAEPERASAHVATRTAELLAVWESAPVDVVAVTNEVGMSVVPATASGRLFRDELGRLNAAVSAASDRVHLVVAGRLLDLSGCPVVP